MGKLTITRCTHTSAKICDKCRLSNALESLRAKGDNLRLWAKEHNVPVIDIPLVQPDLFDLRGLPKP